MKTEKAIINAPPKDTSLEQSVTFAFEHMLKVLGRSEQSRHKTLVLT